ncbi:endonuclease domain-containing protein [Streptomyces angustmyceticus]|uniref:Recombination endonuclease VII n=1 Tax=Streptomyces angustmyceticus TaxID=285578 RepID=A0A5J4L959_9ACTN|nr:endonuclease domain-containing protein [Streptomyces angustmyceticus]UAL65631.1 endonuclease VII domain-containing protein [Streptomyces angustmyceticus]GES27846.1 hypothetical protein San01_03330 [Streptomyces angustmyceticus]
METDPVAKPNRRTQNRHATPGNACTHFMKYGMTCDEYDRLRLRAAGRCELCKTPEKKTVRGSLVIDHFEGGGVFFVRGLLCDKCNAVMSRHDRTTTWGPSSLPWVEQAQTYHRNAFGAPSAEELQLAEECIRSRKPYAVRDRIMPKPPPSPRVPHIRLDREIPAIAEKLRVNLTSEQVGQLIELLSKRR